jgi:hypothetical protein
MPRPMSSAMLAAIQAQHLRPALFVQMQFMTGPLYVWSGTGSVTWNGHTWLGVGTLGTISTIEESGTVEAKGVTLTLSGIDPAMLADALQEFQTGAPVAIYLGLFDSGGSLIANPVTSWAGRMDQPSIEVGGDSAVISIACENRLIEMNVAVDRRYTATDQSIDYPGDLGFNWVLSIQEQNIYWGRVPSSSNNL